MNIQIFSILRNINKHIKHYRKEQAGKILSPVRRIEFVSPPRERICAMTFDDGPTASDCVPDNEGRGGLTAHLLDVLKKYSASATFDVVGSTAENYPDKKGELHKHFVFGIKYDHYSSFGQDNMAGAQACPDLLRRIVSEGHEISNHGYRHRIFGPEYFVYRSRVFQKDLDEVVGDLTRLHELVKQTAGYEMRLARPPHYVDRIGRFGRDTAYTAYGKMGYNYMAASVDGGGWYPTTGDYNRDVDIMVKPLKEMLERDPDCLKGAVIFQKDGYNLSMQSPIADALELQLSLLSSYGYKVVGVEALMRVSPFEDVAYNDDCLEAVCGLDAMNYAIGYKNNTFKPDGKITAKQLDAMCTLSGKWTACKDTRSKILSADEIAGEISRRFGHCNALRGNTRRDTAIALWDAIRASDS